MKCKRKYCTKEAQSLPHPDYPDHVETSFCSWECKEAFVYQQKLDSTDREAYRLPENTLLRIEAKLDKALAIFEKKE